MGLLDRFKKEPGPDALTWEAVARLRVIPGVAGAEAVDANTVEVTWAGHDAPTTLSLAEVREAWTKAGGFDRIEIMDELVAGVAPPVPGSQTPETASPPAEPVPVPDPPPSSDAAALAAGSEADTWAAVRGRLRVVVGRSGEPSGAVSWPLGEVLEARVVLGGPGALPVDGDDVAAWGVSAADVRDAALANLDATEPGLDPIGPGEPAWVPTTPGDHPPVWLASPGRLLDASGLAEAVVLAPTSTELVVVDPAAHDLLGSILTSTKAIVAGESRILWPAPLLATPAGLAPWRPEPGHPCATLVDELGAET